MLYLLLLNIALFSTGHAFLPRQVAFWLDHRIVGGSNADIIEHPHQISLQIKYYAPYGHICGGSIIGPKSIATAAHCITTSTGGVEPASKYAVIAGTSYSNRGGLQYEVVEIRRIPQYIRYTLDYDVAVLILATSIEFDATRKPIALNTIEPAAGALCTTTGWGATVEGGYVSGVLQQVQVPRVTDQMCRNAYSQSAITARMVCAGYARGGKDSCQGDSGGPLVKKNSANEPELVGIVSWGQGCARPDYPGVYAKVSNVEVQQFLLDNTI